MPEPSSKYLKVVSLEVGRADGYSESSPGDSEEQPRLTALTATCSTLSP